MCDVLAVLKLEPHLLAVKQDDKLQGVDGGQQRAKKSSHPDHSLTINQAKHIGGNHKLLPPHPLNRLTGTVIHHKPTTYTKKHYIAEHKTDWPNIQHAFAWCALIRLISLCYKKYLRGNSTSRKTATVMRRSNIVSLYISCPTRVSQHYQ